MLSPSTLSRSFASNCAQCAPSGNDKEARALIATIKTAYLNLPFKGRPLVLPGGLVVVADMWGASLDSTLDDLADSGEGAVHAFSLEAWLVSKVEQDGSPSQREQMRELCDRLDAADVAAPADDELRSFYQSDLSGHFQMQPLMEVEVYRDLHLNDGEQSDDGDGDLRLSDDLDEDGN